MGALVGPSPLFASSCHHLAQRSAFNDSQLSGYAWERDREEQRSRQGARAFSLARSIALFHFHGSVRVWRDRLCSFWFFSSLPHTHTHTTLLSLFFRTLPSTSSGRTFQRAHGTPHVTVGGDSPNAGIFSSHASPLDPLFMLHHSNIDRIWTMWQSCRGDYSVCLSRTSFMFPSIHIHIKRREKDFLLVSQWTKRGTSLL